MTSPAQEPRAGDESAAPSASSSQVRASRRILRRKLVTVAVVVGICAGAVVTRAIWSGTRALAEGDAAHARGDERVAVERWRRAARWYVPGATHVGVAYERLEALARAAEQRGDVDTALAAWRGVRSSILATRSLYLPYEERLDPANRRIAALMAALERRGPAGAGAEGALGGSDGAADSQPGALAAGAAGGSHDGVDSPPVDMPAFDPDDEGASWHYGLLARPLGPSVFWSVVAILGFATWLGGALLFALRGVTADDRLMPRTAAYAGILVALGLVIWLLGLHLA